MASLLERMNIPTNSLGPVRNNKSQSNRGAAAPYNRTNRAPKGDVDSQWSHDMFESHNSLSARLNLKPAAPKAGLNPIAQKAIRDATTAPRSDSALTIKGASAGSQGNVVEVTGLVAGTTAEDVAAIFKRCGQIIDQKSVATKADPRIRITFKAAASATSAVQKFNSQPADGKILSVKIVGVAATSLGGRLGDNDGLGLVRQEGSVDVLMDSEESGSKMRSDSLLKVDPRAQVLVAPPGADPKDYMQSTESRGGRRGRGRGARRGRRGGNGGGGGAGRMDFD